MVEPKHFFVNFRYKYNTITDVQTEIPYLLNYSMEHCATIRKVAGSIPDCVIGVFY